jgi:DNA-binding NtrC family response regulator
MAQQRPLKILLVEDNKDTLRSIGMLLGLRQHKVSMAEKLETALALVDAESFDLILSDIGLPDGNGLDLMRHVQATRPTPGIAMSGFGTDDDIQSSHRAGFIEHLIKPISFQKLEATILEVSTASELVEDPPERSR